MIVLKIIHQNGTVYNIDIPSTNVDEATKVVESAMIAHGAPVVDGYVDLRHVDFDFTLTLDKAAIMEIVVSDEEKS